MSKTSSSGLRAAIFALIVGMTAIVGMSDAFAQKPTATPPLHDSPAIAKSFLAKWVGGYEPAGSGRGPKANSLTINRTAFSWSDCKNTSIRRIAESENDVVFEADPAANCAWAGWIVRLLMPVADSSVISVEIYRTTGDFELKRYKAYYSFSRVAR